MTGCIDVCCASAATSTAMPCAGVFREAGGRVARREEILATPLGIAGGGGVGNESSVGTASGLTVVTGSFTSS